MNYLIESKKVQNKTMMQLATQNFEFLTRHWFDMQLHFCDPFSIPQCPNTTVPAAIFLNQNFLH